MTTKETQAVQSMVDRVAVAIARAAGWVLIGSTPGKSWSVPSRPRTDKHPIEPKLLWERAG